LVGINYKKYEQKTTDKVLEFVFRYQAD